MPELVIIHPIKPKLLQQQIQITKSTRNKLAENLTKMTILTEHAAHSLYNDYSIPLKNSQSEETDLKSSLRYKDCFRSNRSNKASRTSRKIQKLQGNPDLDVIHTDISMNDCDELRDSIHLTRQRIKPRQLDSGRSCDYKLKESKVYLVQPYVNSKVLTSVKNEFTKEKLSHASLLPRESTLARNHHGTRAMAA
jgi:hypothetical protein